MMSFELSAVSYQLLATGLTTFNPQLTTHNIELTTIKPTNMKTIKNTLFIALMLISGFASAQTDKYTTAMKKGVAMLDSARDEQNFLAAANYFERVANVETKQWLPTYYAAYANLFTALTSADQSKKDAIFDKVLDQVNKADGISTNNSEILALKGFAQYMKMSVDHLQD
ncbi:MAG: hypothetical protein JWN56_480 [Sphingobacteriales bacterium]|nr:hypothetical protein [Sphingobacteriales bacterium]